MKRRAFLSYSWQDSNIAGRFYDDLIRSRIDVWRDQIDGDPTTNFLEEFLSKIDQCDDFIILDSKHYRKRSSWCLTEIERCFNNRKRREGPRIIVCLLDKDGMWRQQFNNEQQRLIFSQINLYKYHPLYYEGTYDNEDIYQKSLSIICSLFGEQFVPWNVMPSDRDLLEELTVTAANLKDEDRISILSSYNSIIRFVELNRDVKAHFDNWISDCNYFKLHLFFPRWTYCVWLGNESHNGKYLEECFNEFEKLSCDFPDDPRCFRGLGCVASKLNMNEYAIKSLTQALELMKLPENKRHEECSKIEVLSNLGQLYINVGQRKPAIEALSKALSLLESVGGFDANIVLNLSYCLNIEKREKECKELLLNLAKRHPLDFEIYVELGKIFSNENDNSNAIKYFQFAYELSPSIENGFFLLCRKSFFCNVKEEAKKLLETPSYSTNDQFWKQKIIDVFFDGYYNSIK